MNSNITGQGDDDEEEVKTQPERGSGSPVKILDTRGYLLTSEDILISSDILGFPNKQDILGYLDILGYPRISAYIL